MAMSIYKEVEVDTVFCVGEVLDLIEQANPTELQQIKEGMIDVFGENFFTSEDSNKSKEVTPDDVADYLDEIEDIHQLERLYSAIGQRLQHVQMSQSRDFISQQIKMFVNDAVKNALESVPKPSDNVPNGWVAG